MQNLLSHVRLSVERDDLLRSMGYPDPSRVSEPVRRVCAEQIERLPDLAQPWGTCAEVAIVCAGRHRVDLASGATLHSRRLAALVRGARSLQICLVTLGAAVSAETERLMAANAAVDAFALACAATVATHGLVAHLRQRICADAERHGCSATYPYGPGYTGWELRDLPQLFGRFTDPSVPVRLNEQWMMTPPHSLLVVMGLVPGRQRQRHELVPCRVCDLDPCSLRRAPWRRQPDASQ